MCGSNTVMGVGQRCEPGWAPLSLLVSHVFYQHVTGQLPMGSAFTMTICELIMNFEYSLHM